MLFRYRVSERQISIYHVNNLSAPINTVGLDVSPSILIPFYDEDSSTLFSTGKVWILLKILLCYGNNQKDQQNIELNFSIFRAIQQFMHSK